VFEPVPVGGRRQKPSRNVQSILAPVPPAAAAAGVEQEFTINVEQPVPNHRTTD
jgi:hypothetical protein